MESETPYNPSSRVRAVIYVVLVLGTAVVLPLHEASMVSDLVLKLWLSLSAAGHVLARLNTGPRS